MRTKIILIVVVVCLISLVLASEIDSPSEINSFSAENLKEISSTEKVDAIVVFKQNINETFLEKSGADIKENLESIDSSVVLVDKESIKEIQKNPNIELIEPDINLELFGEGNPMNLSDQMTPWGIEKINASKVWNETTGKNVKIAVIDSGINKDHPDLESNIVGGISFIENANYWDDDLGHGTSVAGVISALNNGIGVIGVAPESKLYSIKVIDASGGKLSNFIQGIQWAIDNDIDIIVMSLGISVDSPSLKRMVDEAYAQGIILVAASGKEGQLYYPAKYSSVIAVGSVNENNELTNENGAGEELEFVAPGANIISTSPEGYGSFDGTSMATPHVAGVIALIKEGSPYLSNNEIRARLQRNAIDLGESGKDNYFGYGIVDAYPKTENLNATLQIIFPEELNNTDFIKVEIIKIENNQEKIVQTLFYNYNNLVENISVESGVYKIKQYFDNNTYEVSYNVSEGDLVVVPLHKTNPPVHQWIAFQAKSLWSVSEFSNYFPTQYNAERSGSKNDVLEGTRMEDDATYLDDGFSTDVYSPCTGWSWDSGYTGNHPYCNHFWDPDGGQDEGLYYSVQWSSSYRRAQNLWDTKVIPLYATNKAESYYWLGRVAHLMTDMGVPAHVNSLSNSYGDLDIHPVSDSYESYMGDNYNNWVASGSATSNLNLYDLFYDMAETTDNFDSDDANGELDAGSRNSCFLGWCTISDSNCQTIGNTLMPESMKHVAGLYRLFWAQTHNLVGCTSGECCDIPLTLTKESGQQPTGFSDYYFVEGTNSPTGTSYIKYRNYYCTGQSSTKSYSDALIETCGVCKYANDGASSCSNYNTATVYDSTPKCSLKSGENNYNTGGEYSCQNFCSGNGNNGYAGNCAFSTACASNYAIPPIMSIITPLQNSLVLQNKSAFNLTLNKFAKEMVVYLDNNIISNCSQCQTIFSNLTNLNDGKHVINTTALDYANNSVSNGTAFSVDTKYPIINSQEPVNETVALGGTIEFKMNYGEENINAIKLYWKSANETKFNNQSIYNFSQGLNQTVSVMLNLSSVSLGYLKYFFQIVDIANRSTNSSLTYLEIVSCLPNWTLEENWSSCQITDLQFKNYIDLNQCGINKTRPIKINQTCDYCTPNWTEVLGKCQQGDSQIGWFNDSNSCYKKTNLNSDLENLSQNITYALTCDFNKDGFIGNLSNINTTIENLTFDILNDTLEFKENNQTIIEFYFNSTNNSLNFGKMFLEKQNNESLFGYILISGLDLTSQGQTKSAYVNKISSTANKLCIRDEELTNINEVSVDCTGNNEIPLNCPGSSGSYSCEIINVTKYKISGLVHSGVKEYTFTSPPADSGNGNTGGGGGGGGGGGSTKKLAATNKTNVTANQTFETVSLPINQTDAGEPLTNEKETAPITGATIGTVIKRSIVPIILLVVIIAGVGIGVHLHKSRKKNVGVLSTSKALKKEDGINTIYKNCENCGTNNAKWRRFCASCGKSLK